MLTENGSSALIWDAERLRIANDAAGIALWSWNVDTDEIALDERAHELWGVLRARAPVTFRALSAKIHPEDLDRVRSTFAETRAQSGPYEIDFRIEAEQNIERWLSARGQSGDVGIVDRVMFGVFMDVTDRKQAEQAREMFADEMSHRLKNLFSLTSALTGLSARSANTPGEMADDLQRRLIALGRAHDLVRPVHGGARKALLGDLLDVLLAPYSLHHNHHQRIAVSVPEIPVGEATATTMALVVHELATNSAKYGALSEENGALDVSCTAEEDQLVLVWTERNGPVVLPPEGPTGFGSKLIARSLSGQLGGSISFDWPPEGAVVTLRMSKARIAR